jgi:hypothetical protein
MTVTEREKQEQQCPASTESQSQPPGTPDSTLSFSSSPQATSLFYDLNYSFALASQVMTEF